MKKYERLNKLQMFAFRGKCTGEYTKFILKEGRSLEYLERVADEIIKELTEMYKNRNNANKIAEVLKYKLERL